MKKQYNKQNKQQSSNQRNSKLYKAHQDLGTKEFGRKQREYYTILSNNKVLDYVGKSPIEAKLFFEQESKLHNGEFTGIVRAYQ